MTLEDLNVSSRGLNFGAGINFLLGWWLFVSPWIYGASWNADAWNSWIVGSAIAILAAIRYGNRHSLVMLRWFTVLLGGWIFFSPWVYGYIDNIARLSNSLCVGVAVFVVAITAWKAPPGARDTAHLD